MSAEIKKGGPVMASLLILCRGLPAAGRLKPRHTSQRQAKKQVPPLRVRDDNRRKKKKGSRVRLPFFVAGHVASQRKKSGPVMARFLLLNTMCCVCLRLDDRYDETESVQMSEQITLRFRSGSSLTG
jgi:hypothetical protein